MTTGDTATNLFRPRNWLQRIYPPGDESEVAGPSDQLLVQVMGPAQKGVVNQFSNILRV